MNTYLKFHRLKFLLQLFTRVFDRLTLLLCGGEKIRHCFRYYANQHFRNV